MKKVFLILTITLITASALSAAPASKPLQHAPTNAAPTPEPAAILLLASGLGAFALRWRKGR